jgi:hypothetical protein
MRSMRRPAGRVAMVLCCAFVGTVWTPAVARAAAPDSKFAVVDANGVLVRGQGAKSATRVAPGIYQVVFNTNVTGCAYTASYGDAGSGSPIGPIEVTVASLASSKKGVFVETWDQDKGTTSDHPFHLKVTCAGNFAVVGTGGALARGSHVTSSQELSTGQYEVIFDHDVTTCAFTATFGTTAFGNVGVPGEITVVGRAGNPNGVFIRVMDPTGAFLADSFHLAVDCGAQAVIAVVNADGTKARGSHVVTSSEIGALGFYEVFFDRKVDRCGYTATIGLSGSEGSASSPATIATTSLDGHKNAVFVLVENVNGLAEDEGFHLKVTCAN